MKKISGLLLLAFSLIAGNALAQGTQISSSQIRDSAVTTQKLADGAVTNSKVGAGAIANLNFSSLTGDRLSYTKINFTGMPPSSVNAESPLIFTSPLIRSVNTIHLGTVPYTSVDFTGAVPSLIGAENPLTFNTPLSRSTNAINFGGVGIDGWFYTEQYNNFTHNNYTHWTVNYDMEGYITTNFPYSDFQHYNLWSWLVVGAGTFTSSTTRLIASFTADLRLTNTDAGPITDAAAINAQAYSDNTANSGVTNLYGVRVRVGNGNTSRSITNISGVYVRAPYEANSAPVGHMYGIYLEDQFVAGTAAGETYQLFSTGKGKTRFKVTDAGVTPLQVQLASTPSANSFEILDSTGTPLTYFDNTGKFVGGVIGNVTGDVQISNNKLTNGGLTAAIEAKVETVVSKYTWANTNIVACGANLTCDITVATLPAKTIVKRVLLVVTGTAANIGTLTGAIGTTATTYTDYVVASDLKVASNTVYGDTLAELGTALQDYLGNLPNYAATTVVKFHLIATDGGSNKLADVTGSSGAIYIETLQLP
jgi:hypothetical protein